MKNTLTSKFFFLTTLLSAAMLLGHLSTASASSYQCVIGNESTYTVTIPQYQQNANGTFTTNSGGDKILNQLIFIIDQTDRAASTSTSFVNDGSVWTYHLLNNSSTVLGYANTFPYPGTDGVATDVLYMPLATGTATVRFICNTPDDANYKICTCTVNIVDSIPVTPASN